MGVSAWTSLLLPIVIGLSFAIFRRVFPPLPDDGPEVPLSDAECRAFARCDRWAWVPFSIFAPLLIYQWNGTLVHAAGRFAHPTPETRYLWQPASPYWLLPAIYLGLISSVSPSQWCWGVLLGARYRIYERYRWERLGEDVQRMWKPFVVLTAVGTAIWFTAGITSFARFDRAGVEVGRPFSLQSTYYDYARVKEIEHRATFRAPNGSIVSSPHYVITFDDESTWSSRRTFQDRAADPSDQIAQLVAKRSGQMIRQRP